MEILYLKSYNLAKFLKLFYMVSIDNRLMMSITAICQCLSELSCSAFYIVVNSRAAVYLSLIHI